MARLTFNLELDSKPDSNGFTAVMVRLHLKGEKPARLLTAVKVENVEKHWVLLDEKQKEKFKWGKWVFRHRDADALNAKIESEFNRIKKLVDAWQQEDLEKNPQLAESILSPKQIANRYKTQTSDAYFILADQVELETKEKAAIRTYLARKTSLNFFKAFAGEYLTLQQVTVDYLEEFQNYLKKHTSPKTKKRLKPSTINQYTGALAAIHIDILRLKGYTRKKARMISPFAELEELPSKTGYRTKFDEDTIQQMNTQFKVAAKQRISAEEAFSVWMLSHLLAGARIGDILMLRYFHFQLDQQGEPYELRYTMSKTGRVVTIPVFAETRQLLKQWWRADAQPTDYVLPYLNADEAYAKYLTREELYAAPYEHRSKLDSRRTYWNKQINIVLAQIQKENKLKGDLRMHNARHSFADLARRIMQEDKTLNPLDITLMLGQSDFRMTMKYLEDLGKQDATRPMEAVFNRKKVGKDLSTPE